MAKNIDVAECFANGNDDKKTNNLFIEDNVLYSYGYHYPLAIRLTDDNGFKFIVNKDRYSQTTSCHRGLILRAINVNNLTMAKSTAEMKQIIDKKIISFKELIINSLA